jgi:integrase
MGHKRRGHGEGSVYQRADGYWVGAVEAGRTPEGRRRKARVVRKRKQDVLPALDELRRQVGQGVVPDRSRTVADYMSWWLAEVVEGTVADTSMHEYRARVTRINAGIGQIRLGKLTTAHVQHFANRLAETYPRSPRTRAHTLGTLRAAMRWAVGADLIARNPAEAARAPRTVTTTLDDTLTPAEAKAVLRAARGDTDLGAMWWLAVSYGLRKGELMALRWGDVDFAEDEMTVRQSKTEAGERTLPLIPEARRVLVEHRRANTGGVASIDRLVFSRSDGRPLYYQLVDRRWKALLTKAKVTHKCRNCGSVDECSTSVRRFHVSRHTAATMLLEAGVELETVSAILGHSSISITADVYARVRSDLKRKGLSKLDQAQG